MAGAISAAKDKAIENSERPSRQWFRDNIRPASSITPLGACRPCPATIFDKIGKPSKNPPDLAVTIHSVTQEVTAEPILAAVWLFSSGLVGADRRRAAQGARDMTTN